MNREQKLPLYDHHVQSTNYQASDHDEPHAENVNIPKQAPEGKLSLI